jgi:hypothetical protein
LPSFSDKSGQVQRTALAYEQLTVAIYPSEEATTYKNLLIDLEGNPLLCPRGQRELETGAVAAPLILSVSQTLYSRDEMGV